MRRRRKDNKKIYLLLVLLGLTLGYALVSTTLKIDGLISLKDNVWDIHWDSNSINITAGSVNTDPSNIVLSEKSRKLNFSASLTKPGDFYEFTIDAVNAGTLDGMISQIVPTIKDGNDQDTTLPSYIHFDVTYDDGEKIEQYHKLAKRVDAQTPTRETFLIRVEFDPETEVLPDSNLSFNLGYELKYVQADNNAIDRKVVSVDGVIFNNVMFNLAYNANKSSIHHIDTDSISPYIEHVTRASTAQYNAVKDVLSSSELVNLNTNAAKVSMLSIATNSAVEMDNRANMNIYMWYDKPSLTIYYYSPDAKIVLPRDVSDMFWGLYDAVSIDVTDFDTHRVKNMANMFRWQDNMTSYDLSNFDTSKVTNMSYMFCGSSNLTSVDLSSFNTSNVEDMSSMFRESGISTLQYITNWDVRKVKKFDSMFYDNNNIPVSLDLSGWHTDSATSMEDMFGSIENLKTLDISNFNTANVINMNGMFYYSRRLQTIYAGDNWTTQNVSDSRYMFDDCTSLVGGNGTRYSSSKIDKTYARIDAAGSPGYFTRKTN